MFEGSGTLELGDDHLDLSFRELDSWPSFTPQGTIRSQAFRIGDPTSGPSVLLGAISDVPGEELDWKHDVDPMHFHGSDQFRILLGGDWVLAREPMKPGDFGFQEAARVYQEHPGPSGRSWIFLVYGDKRGEPSTLTLEEDRRVHGDESEIYGSPVAAGDYPHPAGRKGIPAIATTAGPCRGGYQRSSFDDAASWPTTVDGVRTLAGVWGDVTTGPVVYLMSVDPDRVAKPACRWSTEAVLVVAGGSARIDGNEYVGGELRVQRADCMQGAVVSGPGGLQAALMIGDRRAEPTLADPSDAFGVGWKAGIEVLRAGL